MLRLLAVAYISLTSTCEYHAYTHCSVTQHVQGIFTEIVLQIGKQMKHNYTHTHTIKKRAIIAMKMEVTRCPFLLRFES